MKYMTGICRRASCGILDGGTFLSTAPLACCSTHFSLGITWTELAARACTNHMYCGWVWGGRVEASKHGTRSVVTNVGLQWMPIALLNVFSFKERSTPERCILICVLSCYSPTSFFSIIKASCNTTEETGVNLQQRCSAAGLPVTRLLNRMRSYCVLADLVCADW